jgi:hypothetical protein
MTPLLAALATKSRLFVGLDWPDPDFLYILPMHSAEQLLAVPYALVTRPRNLGRASALIRGR